MDHKLSVPVQADLNRSYVRLAVTGCPTAADQDALCPLIRRARTLVPPVMVGVDLTASGHVDPIAVDLLRWVVDHVDGAGPVHVLAPNGLLGHRRAPVRPTGALETSGRAA